MSGLVPSQFVSPSPRSELNGELGLDHYQIAQSLGAEPADIKRAMDKNINDYSLMQSSTIVDAGPIRGKMEVPLYVLSIEDAKFFVAGYNNEIGKAYRRHLIETEKRYQEQSLNLATLFTDPTKGILFLQKVAEQNEKIKALAQERDQAIRAKGQISSTREAETMGKLSGLVRHMRKRGIAVPPFVETDNEEDSSEEVQKLEEQVKKLDKALEEYRRKENLQEEENQTYHPTSKNGIGINDALREWGLSLTTTNSREINASIRSYLINIGGEILWTDSTFKGAPSKRCVWHPRFLDKNKGRILNFLTNEGWLKKA